MNCSDFFFKISVVFFQNIKKGYMYMVDCVVIYYYVYVCMDLEGVSVQENVLGILYFGEKNFGFVYNMYIVRVCICCIFYYCICLREGLIILIENQKDN